MTGLTEDDIAQTPVQAPDAAPATAPAKPMRPAPRLATIHSANGQTAQVNADYAYRFQGLINDLEAAGYKIHSLSGFVRRNVAGTDEPSYHSDALALDVNGDTNPQGGKGDIPPELARTLAHRWGFGWGGDFQHAKPDPMHFSLAAHEGGVVDISPSGKTTLGAGAPAGLTAEQAAEWEKLYNLPEPTTPEGQTPGTTRVQDPGAGFSTPATKAQEAARAKLKPEPNAALGSATNPYFLAPGRPLPTEPGSVYIDFDGKAHTVPGGILDRAKYAAESVWQGTGADTLASAIRTTAGGLATPGVAFSAPPQTPTSDQELRSGALSASRQQQNDYALTHTDEASGALRFAGQMVPSIGAGILAPEIRLPGAAAEGMLGMASRFGSRVLTNAGKGAASVLPTVGTNDAPIAPQLAAGALGAVVGEPVIRGTGNAMVALADLGPGRTPRPSALGFNPDFSVPPKVARRAASYVASKTGNPDLAMVDAAAAGRPVMTAEMLGQPGVEALRTTGRRSGMTGPALQETLERRAGEAPQTLADDYARIAGVAPGEARSQIEAIVKAGRQRVAPLYTELEPMPMPQSDKLEALLARPSMRDAVKRAAAIAAEEGRDPMTVGLITSPDGATVSVSHPTMQTVDYVKRGLDDVLEARRDPTTGRLPTDNLTQRMQDTRKDYLAAVTAGNYPATRLYGSALRQSGDYLSAQEAYDLGRRTTFDNKVAVEDFANRFAGMNDSEKAAFRAGQARAVSELQSTGRLKPTTFSAPIVQDKLRVVLGDQGAQDFMTSVGHTRQVTANNARLAPNVNSPTSNVMLEARNQDTFGGGPRGILGELATDVGTGTLASGGNPAAGAHYALIRQGTKGIGALGNWIASGGMNEATRDEAGRILMSDMTPDALRDYVSRATAVRSSPAGNALRNFGGLTGPTQAPLSALALHDLAFPPSSFPILQQVPQGSNAPPGP